MLTYCNFFKSLYHIWSIGPAVAVIREIVGDGDEAIVDDDVDDDVGDDAGDDAVGDVDGGHDDVGDEDNDKMMVFELQHVIIMVNIGHHALTAFVDDQHHLLMICSGLSS